MDVSSKLTSKGQVTVPKPVREALGLEPGDSLLFRIERGRALVSKTPDFIALAGSVEVPPGKRGVPWQEVRRRAWDAQTRDRT
jgi:antitoxin PrlF